MNRPLARQELALEADFKLGLLDVRPSKCRVLRGDAEVRVEAQTMSALVVLARAAGATVTREELVYACWQGRFVSDDAIARTIAKVRLLVRGMEPQPFILETVPKVGYRLITGSTEADGTEQAANEPSPPPAPSPERNRRPWMLAVLVTGSMLVAFWAGSAFSRRSHDSAAQPPEKTGINTKDVQDAVLSLNEDRLAGFLANGWKANWPIDAQNNTALHVLPAVCAPAYAHDPASALRIAKQLVAAGADPALRNKWNDTAYIIAREGRYCGPQHPVTVYLRSITPGAEADPVDKQVGVRSDIH